MKSQTMIRAVLSMVVMSVSNIGFAATLNLSDRPLAVGAQEVPLAMLVMGKNHRLFNEAYNDASDLDGDGELDIRFQPDMEYFGYFNSGTCYDYASGIFVPKEGTVDKTFMGKPNLFTCSGLWSGNFLNYVTTSRMDALRKVLYGGTRYIDTTTRTVLERAYIPQDAHSWGKEYTRPNIDGYKIADYTPLSNPHPGMRHLFANVTLLVGSGDPLMRIMTNVDWRIWEWVTTEAPVASDDCHRGTTRSPCIVGMGPTRTDYVVRVEVCNPSILEENCHEYGEGTGVYKPVGLLHEYGESRQIKFGMLSGSFAKGTEGGVLRKNISFFTDEVNSDDGIFTSLNGIVQTIDALKIVNFTNSPVFYERRGWLNPYFYDLCPGAFVRPINSGECGNWGNPISEMMYETMRYFSGRKEPTIAYDYSGPTPDSVLGLPKVNWDDPYENNPACAKPVQLIISDVSPTYDTDSVPGSAFSPFSGNKPVPGFNSSISADEVYAMEYGSARTFYIGQSGGLIDFASTPKTVTKFSNIRGLAPEDPSKFGGFYSAGLAWYGKTHDLHASAESNQFMETFAVALNSPVPTIEITVAGRVIKLIPFARSPSLGAGYPVGGNGGNPLVGSNPGNPNAGWVPTNQIADFFVEEITPTYGKFRVNFEGAEYGINYDMDAIVIYEYQVVGNEVTVTLNSVYASAWFIQHMGYVISGTNGADGTYLVVRDLDTTEADDRKYDYFLDAPLGRPANNGGPLNNTGWDDNIALPLTSVRTFSPGVNPAADSLKTPLWYAAKYGSFNDEDEDGTPANNTLGNIEWDEDGDGDPDNYFLVTNALGLSAQLSRAFQKITERASASASLAVNAGRLSTDSLIFQARFDPKGWQGQLRAFALGADGIPAADPIWDASVVLQSMALAHRKIITYNPVSERGVPFRWPADATAPEDNEISLAHVGELIGTYAGGDVDDYGSDLVAYIRGSNPTILGRAAFRERESQLGDIVNSDPMFVGPPGRGFPDNWGTGAPENLQPYSAFEAANSDRTPVLYVGANDGMFHGFKATALADGSDGRELISFVPTPVFRNLHEYAAIDYTDQRHTFYVDGSPKVDDVFVDGQWRTMVVAGLGGGGQGYFALDVTDPSGFSESNAQDIVMWEFTDEDDVDMGFSYAEPAIGRMHNAQWAVAIGSGYNSNQFDAHPSASGNAVLFILDAKDGSIIKKLDTLRGTAHDPLGLARGNGMATPRFVDFDGDLVADYIYAADLFGNVWKVDITSVNSSDWDFANYNGVEPQPFYTAVDSLGIAQPITIPLEIGPHPLGQGHLLIAFGTGKFLEVGDNTTEDQKTQTLYTVWDDLSGNALASGRSSLLKQSIIAEVDYDPGAGNDLIHVRVTSNHGINWTAHKGWYMDLVNPSDLGDNRGERVVRKLSMRAGRLIITTLIPSEDVCHAGGGSGWLMEIIASSGSRLGLSPYDLNDDNIYTSGDFIDIPGIGPVPVSGIKPQEGIPSPPAVMKRETDEIKIFGVSSGSIETVSESVDPGLTGRQSWRQIR